jgi:hypothetical protein
VALAGRRPDQAVAAPLVDVPRDPAFAAKAGVVLDQDPRVFQAAELSEDEYVISADEKTSIQARCRCHPTLPPGQARSMRVEHEYERRGALAYLVAWDVHHARLFGAWSRRLGSTRSGGWWNRS